LGRFSEKLLFLLFDFIVLRVHAFERNINQLYLLIHGEKNSRCRHEYEQYHRKGRFKDQLHLLPYITSQERLSALKESPFLK